MFGATAEAMERDLRAAGVPGAAACFIDPSTSAPYRLHFFAFEVLGDTLQGGSEVAHAALVAGVIQLRCPEAVEDRTLPSVSGFPSAGSCATSRTFPSPTSALL